MGVKIRPPFMFRPVADNGAVALQISCSRCSHALHLEGKDHGTLSLDRAADLYEALGDALAEARALDPRRAPPLILWPAAAVPDAKTDASETERGGLDE